MDDMMKAADQPRKARVKLYVHRSKESNWDLGDAIGLPGAAIMENFKWCCYEVEIEIELDMETGEHIIIGVDGKRLEGVKQTDGILPEYDEANIVT